MSTTVADIAAAMESLAPTRLAEDWDNVGLLIGGDDWSASRVLCTIDLTRPVLEEAVKAEVDMIIAYHPLLFAPIKRLTSADPGQSLVIDCIRNGIAVYSPHTALDAAPGGMNDWLADALGSGDVRALSPHESLPSTEQCKIVTFCPRDAVMTIRQGLASVGAGRIGDYELCSFETKGHGTFLGGENTSPTVGLRGRLERVEETRLEMVCSRDALGLAVMALRQFHPYEEPPVEIHDLRPIPQRNTGVGRRVTLDRAASMKTIVERLHKGLGVRQVRVASAQGGVSRITTIGLCVGAGGSLLQSAIAQGCQLFITGEMRHHDVLAAQAQGCHVILAGHTNTERGYLKVLQKRLSDHVSGVNFMVSRRDAVPWKVM